MIDIEKKLIDLGSAVEQVTFNSCPDNPIALDFLIEGNDAITFELLNRKKPFSVGCLPDHVNSRITSAHIETECFIDYDDFYCFTSLETLYLSISRTNIDYFDDRQVAGLWHVLSDLASGHLKRVEFDISALPDTSQEQIKTLFSNPYKVVDLEFT